MSTFGTLRALHALIGDAIDDIHRVFTDESPSPSESYAPDFPSPETPYDPTSPAELLAAHPLASAAASRIVAASGHLAALVQKPFLVLCDASMAHNLPASLRLLEHMHIVEILRDAEDARQAHLDAVGLNSNPEGLHVRDIARVIRQHSGARIDHERLAHTLRLLATHHLLRETAPDVFAGTRVASLLDTGKTPGACFASPEKKYENTDGVAAFVGLCTDELFKSAAYLTEAFVGVQLPSSSTCTSPSCAATATATPAPIPATDALLPATDADPDPLPAFNIAFQTASPYFEWLEDGGRDARGGDGAMTGTSGWEAPGAILSGFDWHALPRGATIVDVGGGIGSTTMVLARAAGCTNHRDRDYDFKFVVQDRPVVVGLGLQAWRAQCAEMLEEGRVVFQEHDFFAPQPPRAAPPAVFLLRVVLHDWPDDAARRILLRLREAAGGGTRLIIADHVLPLACVDEELGWGGVDAGSEGEGAERTLASAPLLPNLGKASANAYWMDLTMHSMFNGKERTLRELCALALSAGWRVTRVTRAEGSLFGHLVCEP
ncbi:S-adenosyl-L-methionine-dependent methyltransferase, partial [Leucogyrophana mollusca]